MKKLIVTLAIAIAPVGFIGLTGAMAATSNTWTAPGHTNYFGAPGSCPTMDAGGANTQPIIGAAGV